MTVEEGGRGSALASRVCEPGGDESACARARKGGRRCVPVLVFISRRKPPLTQGGDASKVGPQTGMLKNVRESTPECFLTCWNLIPTALSG